MFPDIKIKRSSRKKQKNISEKKKINDKIYSHSNHLGILSGSHLRILLVLTISLEYVIILDTTMLYIEKGHGFPCLYLF